MQLEDICWGKDWLKRNNCLKEERIKKIVFRDSRNFLFKSNYFCPGLRTSLISLVFNRIISYSNRANEILANKFSDPDLELLNLNECDGVKELGKSKNAKELNELKIDKLINNSSRKLEESVFNRAEQLETEAIFRLAQEAHKNGQKGFTKIFFSYLIALLGNENLKEFQ